MNKEILKRFFEGHSSRWEKKQVQEYLERDDLQVMDEYIKGQQVEAVETELNEDYKMQFFSELHTRIHHQENLGKTSRRRSLIPLFRIAAGIILISSIAGFLYISRQKAETAELLMKMTSINNSGHDLKLLELKDGTKIWMNPGTTITFNEHSFGDTSRQVSIEGEAFFNVAHDKTKPFRVKAGQLTTTVLGTTFNVEAYDNEPEVRILLVTGRVRISTGQTHKTMHPGELLNYTRSSNRMDVNTIDVSDKQEQLTSGKLVFENLPLADVLKRLERVFNVQLIIADPTLLDHKRISGSYYRDNAASALGRILFIHGLHYHKKGDQKYVIEQ